MCTTRSKSDQRAAVEDDLRRAQSHVPHLSGTHPRDVPQTPRPVTAALLQKHGTRGAVARVCPKAHHGYPANHRIRQDGARLHEAQPGRPNRLAQSW